MLGFLVLAGWQLYAAHQRHTFDETWPDLDSLFN